MIVKSSMSKSLMHAGVITKAPNGIVWTTATPCDCGHTLLLFLDSRIDMVEVAFSGAESK